MVSICKELTRLMQATVLDNNRLLWVYTDKHDTLSIFECSFKSKELKIVTLYEVEECRSYALTGRKKVCITPSYKCTPAEYNADTLCARFMRLYVDKLRSIARALGVSDCKPECVDRSECIDSLIQCIWDRVVEETSRIVEKIEGVTTSVGILKETKRRKRWIVDLGKVEIKTCAPIIASLSNGVNIAYTLLNVKSVGLKAKARVVVEYDKQSHEKSVYLELKEVTIDGDKLDDHDVMVLGFEEIDVDVYRVLLEPSQINPLYPSDWSRIAIPPSSGLSIACIARWLYSHLQKDRLKLRESTLDP